ncbi:MAG: hypothetical protein GYA14_01970 [Ignavibacteria bacterium]|nr:hypothetical protein [Ignavibacteria bacterium]
MKLNLVCFLIIAAFLISCNNDTKINPERTETQLEAAIQFQSLLIKDLSQKFKVDTLGGSFNSDNSFTQFDISDSIYDHSNTYNYALQTYLNWKEKYSQYKISVLFQGGNHFSFELKDDYTVTTVNLISYAMDKKNLIEFNIRSVPLNL